MNAVTQTSVKMKAAVLTLRAATPVTVHPVLVAQTVKTVSLVKKYLQNQLTLGNAPFP